MIKFEDRSVIQHNKSLFINLPSLWVKNNNIEKQDRLKIIWDQENDCLILKKVIEAKNE